VDYESLDGAGAMMGSGGLVVLDEDDCLVEVARYFMSFTQAESCGACTFCRVGTKRMLEILERLCSGGARRGDVERLEELATWVSRGSRCGLGRTAPNPVTAVLTHFRDEVEAHLVGCCPAGRCSELIDYVIGDECIGCTICAQRCCAGAIAPLPYEVHRIDPELCTRCGGCRELCPVDAVQVVSPRGTAALVHGGRAAAPKVAGRAAGDSGELVAGR
jgi:ferredoxin